MTGEPLQDPAVDPVLCSAYEPPNRHWALDDIGRADRTKPPLDGRRPSIHIPPAPADSKVQQQIFGLKDRKPNPVIQELRAKIGDWREHDYPDVTATTRRLLLHWNDMPASGLKPFFAQMEAIETFIWLREVATRRQKVRSVLQAASMRHNDSIVRLCAKMATGTGKTVVMGMLIAWQTLNAVRHQRSRNVLHTNRFVVFTPGHTVRHRLQVLIPSREDNVYDEMDLVPRDMRGKLHQARVDIVNYQGFQRRDLIEDSKTRRLVGRDDGSNLETQGAAVRRVLNIGISDRKMPICVINDEAHHCYLPESDSEKSVKGEKQSEQERAALWFNAIRSLRDQGLLGPVTEHGQNCPIYDFSATPLWIESASKSEPRQFEWVSSDFGLMDAIESGLVKVPRVPIDDDSSRDETVWRQLYKNTSPKTLQTSLDKSGDLPEPLNHAVTAVVNGWEERLRIWETPDEVSGQAQPTPPVIIFVANTVKNATALWSYLSGEVNEDGSFRQGKFAELSNVDEFGEWYDTPRTLLVHSKISEGDTIPKPLLKAWSAAHHKKEKQADIEATVREILNTVGKYGQPGAQVRCVVSVGMLTEGWDCRTVTHIVGFRAFGTQLLCEQVTGRALRRTAYDAFREPDESGLQLLEAEYADVVGIPFEFMPSTSRPVPAPRPKPRTQVYTVAGKRDFRVAWPNVTEYQRILPTGVFALNADLVGVWSPPQSSETATMTVTEGFTGESELLHVVSMKDRERTSLLKFAAKLVREVSAPDGLSPNQGRRGLFQSAVRATKLWAAHPNVRLGGVGNAAPDGFWAETVVIDNSYRHVRDQILKACEFSSTAESMRALLGAKPIMETDNVNFQTTLSHILDDLRNCELSHAACHSHLEFATAEKLNTHPRVARWARNFQLGWYVPYWRDTGWARYEPDFVATIDNNVHLIIECKGVWDSKAEQAAEYTKNYWIPAVAGTADLPGDLRVWEYCVVDDRNLIRAQLDEAISRTDLMLAEEEAA